MQTLWKPFSSICNYYGKVGQEDSVTGEIKYSYKDFWNELAGLVDQQPSEISNESNTRLTQLRLLDDIAYQMYSYAAQFASRRRRGQSNFPEGTGSDQTTSIKCKYRFQSDCKTNSGEYTGQLSKKCRKTGRFPVC